jgi:hypothetical protein
MGALPMIEKGIKMAGHTDWPLFYMNDFSRLGLVVNGLPEAVQALENGGYRFRQDAQGGVVEITGREQLSEILAVLREHQVEYELSDLVSCVYQG